MQSPKVLCVIPSRLHSTRLPEKPLVLINEKPMVQWVYEGACKCAEIAKVIVATDDKKIANVIELIGGQVVLTPPSLPTGTDRVAYVANQFPEYDIIINLQGDEPFIRPEMLSALIAPFINNTNKPQMATLACPLNREDELNNSNVVKVLCNKNNEAIIFTRSSIPFFRTENVPNLPLYSHLGLYAFTREFLNKFTKWEQTPIEKTELLEQMRALENGVPIYVSLTPHKIIEINYPEDLVAAREYAKGLV